MKDPATNPHRFRPLRLLLAAGLLAVVAVAGFWRPAQSYPDHLTAVAKTTAGLPRYGIAAGSSLTDMSPDQLDAYMTKVHNLGAGWVRFDFDWSLIQPNNADDFQWEQSDAIVAAARKHNLLVIGILDFTPSWARADACRDIKQCHPADPAAFAKFAGAVVARYAPQDLHYWEVWNEPNTSHFWAPAPSVTEYSDLLIATYSSIHRADSSAIVISGSMAPATTSQTDISPADFLKGLYSAQAKTAFDAVGDHPYTYPVPPNYNSDHAWAKMSQGQNNLRAIMGANGDGAKKIWITEYGAPTGGPGPEATSDNLNLSAQPWHVSEELQAVSIEQAVADYKTYNWAGPFLVYSLVDAGTTPDTNENFFGLEHADGSAKPAYDSFRQAIQP